MMFVARKWQALAGVCLAACTLSGCFKVRERETGTLGAHDGCDGSLRCEKDGAIADAGARPSVSGASDRGSDAGPKNRPTDPVMRMDASTRAPLPDASRTRPDAAIARDAGHAREAGFMDETDAPQDAPAESGRPPLEAGTCYEGAYALFNGDYSGDGHELEGIVEVTGNAEILLDGNSLRYLGCLRRIDGDTALIPNSTTTPRTDLEGMALESIGGELLIGIRVSVGTDPGPLPVLASLHGLEHLKSIGAGLILGVAGLQDLNALAGLEAIGIGFSAFGSASSAPEFRNLHGLEHVTDLGFILVSDLPALESLEGMPPAAALTELAIINVPHLSSLAPLSATHQIDALALRGLPRLADLSGLEAVTSLTTIDIENCPIQSLAPLSHVDSKLTSLQLSDDSELTTLDGLQQIASIGQITISRSGLTSLDGLNGVTHLGGALFVGNASLARIDALSHLTQIDARMISISQQGAFTLQNSPLLTSLHGLEGLMNTSARLAFNQLPALTSLAGLSSLRSASDLELVGLPMLKDLTGLENLTSLSRSLSIIDNAELTSIDALAGLTRVDANVAVFGNPKLSHCAANALSARLGKTCSCPQLAPPQCLCDLFQTQHYVIPVNCLDCGTITACTCENACDCSGNDNTTTCPP